MHAVFDGDNWLGDELLSLAYGTPEEFPAGFWVSYATDQDPLVLRSSRLLVISKRSGDVSHLGDVGGEG